MFFTQQLFGRGRLKLVAIACLCLLLSSKLSADTTKHRVENLFYGAALFDYFQQNQLRAITALLVAEQKIQNQSQRDESDLLLADLYYHYGLYSESDRLFSRLLNDNTSQSLRNRVWFNLAQLNHDQGFYPQASELLMRIDGDLPNRLNDEKFYLLTNLHLRDQQLDAATKASQRIDGESDWQVYAAYNIGVSLIENNRYDEGEVLLAQIGNATVNSNEMLALRDQANLSLGLSQLRRSKPQNALTNLERIRLQSPLAHDGLLAAGWAWHRLDSFDQALVVWLELAQKNSVDAPTQEALVAIPAALEQNQKPKLAVNYYELAANQFDRQLQVLDQAISTIRSGELINLLYQNALLVDSSNFAIVALESSTASYLHLLMASTDFQIELKRYQELIDIRATLSHWRGNLPTLSLMLSERRRNFQNKLPQLTKSNDFARINLLRQSRNRYAAELNRIEASNDYLGLANTEEKLLLQRLAKVSNSIKKIGDRKNTESQKDMFRMLKGLLHWQLSTDFAPRLWAARKQLNSLDQALSVSANRVGSLSQLSGKNLTLFDDFDSRIDGQDEKIIGLVKRVDDLVDRQQNRINRFAIEALEVQQQHILQLRLNARYALARLYDTLVTR